MSNIEKVTLNYMGVRKLLKSQEVMDCLISKGASLGKFEDKFVGFDRCNVIIKKETQK